MRGGYFGTRPFGVPGWSCGYCLWRCRCSRAPSGPAAREIATRELRSEWSISKPARALRTLRRPPHRQRWVVVCGGQALPPPTDTAAIPPGPAAPSIPAALGRCVWWPGPAAAHGHRDHALHTGGAVLLCVVARPCRRPRIPRPCLRALRHPPPCGLTWFRVWQTQAGKLRSGQWGLFYGRCPIRLLRGLCGPCGAEAGTSPCRGAIGPHRRIQKRPGP